jgi:DNA-binding transcriptional ArsR family regulator
MLDRDAITRFLTALGDQARLEILELLLERGRLNVGEIAAHSRLSRPTVSHHLKVLKDAAILDHAKQGKESFYWCDNAYVAEQLRALADLVASCAAPDL